MALSENADPDLEGSGTWFDVGGKETLEEANKLFAQFAAASETFGRSEADLMALP